MNRLDSRSKKAGSIAVMLAISMAGCGTIVSDGPPETVPPVSETSPSASVPEIASESRSETPSESEIAPPVSEASPSASAPETASESRSETPSESTSSIPETTSTPSPQSETPSIETFNAPDSPLEVGYLSELEGDITCRQTGGIFTYAETENFLIYICSDEGDRSQPRYYRSFNRDGTPGLSLEATDYNPLQGRYFEFKNNDYSYLLQIPTGAIPNPKFTIQLPDGSYLEETVTRYLAKE